LLLSRLVWKLDHAPCRHCVRQRCPPRCAVPISSMATSSFRHALCSPVITRFTAYMAWSDFPLLLIARLAPRYCPLPVDERKGSPKFMKGLSQTCRSQRPRWPKTGSLQRLSFFRLPRTIQRVGDHNFYCFGVNAHSSHRFGLSARTSPALTRRLPSAPGCALRLCLLDFKAVIFASHKLLSRLLAHDSHYKRGRASIAGFRVASHKRDYVGLAGGPRPFSGEPLFFRVGGPCSKPRR
jgi:hypothetical protein